MVPINALDTVKLAGLVAVPAGVVTLTFPLVAPGGTLVEIWVADTTVKDAAVPLNLTDAAPENPDPVIATATPAEPLDGSSPVMTGPEDGVVAEASFE